MSQSFLNCYDKHNIHSFYFYNNFIYKNLRQKSSKNLRTFQEHAEVDKRLRAFILDRLAAQDQSNSFSRLTEYS